jgi:exocyst complex component 4
MSRPYPRRGPSPAFNGPPSAGATRPLQINRPTTPSNSIPNGSPRTGIPSTPAPGGPSRPQRSELRSRPGDLSSDRNSSFRDSYASESSASSRRPPSNNAPAPPVSAGPRSRTPRYRNESVDDEMTSPSSLTNVMSAFQSAGTRRRAMTNGSDDMDYQREREQAREEERARQRRIQNKAPGRRTNERVRPGDIDG